MKHPHLLACVALGVVAVLLAVVGAGVLALACAAGCALMGGMMFESRMSENSHRHA